MALFKRESQIDDDTGEIKCYKNIPSPFHPRIFAEGQIFECLQSKWTFLSK